MQYLVEETYELVDAIEAGDDAELVEELGDVLYQVIFHSDIAAEEGRFTLEDVAAHMTAKMVGRHPHVFGDAVADTPDAVMARWDELKRVEKPGRASVLDGIPQGMPALALAAKLVGRAEKVGLTGADIEDMYRIMAIANYEDRFVIPTAHREWSEDAFDLRGSCGFSFGNGCSGGTSETNLFGTKQVKKASNPMEIA